MWIDTHCHLDAAEFAVDRELVYQRSQAAQVDKLVVPAVSAANFMRVAELSAWPGVVYALGLHPLYVDNATVEDLSMLRFKIKEILRDPNHKLVAIGEIGLDFFVPGVDFTKQEYFLVEQLKLAQTFNLPVLLHIRRAQDQVLKHLRRICVPGGIAHAFNGSRQQAEQFITLGFKLGFGGAFTFDRALQIRRLAATLPLTSLVLETDSPDIPPAWLWQTKSTLTDNKLRNNLKPRNSPEELPRIASALAGLRQLPLAELAAATSQNVREVLPRIGMV